VSKFTKTESSGDQDVCLSNEKLDLPIKDLIEEQRRIISGLEDTELVSKPEFSSLVNFSEARKEPIHRWFKYREGFSPSLVYAFFENEKRVIDPFCGSGTTLVCARLKGIDTIGVDINPLAIFVARAKIAPYTKDDLELFSSFTDKILKDKPGKSKDVDLPKLGIINKIFPEDITRHLLELKTSINAIKEDRHRNFLLLGWLAMLESVSNTRKEGNGIKYRTTKRTPTGYVHESFEEWQRRFYGEDRRGFINNRFKSQIRMMIDDARAFSSIPESKAEVIEGSATHLSDLVSGDKASLIIFSPPYANCFDYFEIFKVELWMGSFVTSYDEMRDLRRNSLGSLWHANSITDPDIPGLYDLLDLVDQNRVWDQKVMSMLTAYFTNMKIALSEIHEKLLPQGKCVIVVGNSAYSGIVVPTDLILSKIARQVGFRSQEMICVRHLTTSSQQKKRLEPLKRYLRESIVVLRN